MKKLLTILALLLTFSIGAIAQETAKPTTDTEIVRKVSFLDIEGKYYSDVIVTMKSTTPDYLISDKYKVKVNVKDSTGKTVWKKTLKNVFMYVYSKGQVEIKNGNFIKMILWGADSDGRILGEIREKEGIY